MILITYKLLKAFSSQQSLNLAIHSYTYHNTYIPIHIVTLITTGGFEFTSCQSSTDISSSSKFCNNNSIYESQPGSESSQHSQLNRHQRPGGIGGGSAAVDGSNNNIALIKIGEASALPVMLCGILQNKELFYQQAHEHQKQFLAQSQSSPDYFKDHRHSLSSAYQNFAKKYIQKFRLCL